MIPLWAFGDSVDCDEGALESALTLRNFLSQKLTCAPYSQLCAASAFSLCRLQAAPNGGSRTVHGNAP
jgi:hypothetical protein